MRELRTVFLAVLFPQNLVADFITPSDFVVNKISIRFGAITSTELIEKLKARDLPQTYHALLWHKVYLTNARSGFITKAWSSLVTDSVVTSVQYTIHIIDVSSDLAVLVRSENFVYLYDADSSDELAKDDRNRITGYFK